MVQSLAGYGKTILPQQGFRDMNLSEKRPTGCSKSPDFSPARPWRAETRLAQARPQRVKQAEVEFKVERRSESRDLSLGLNLNLAESWRTFSASG